MSLYISIKDAEREITNVIRALEEKEKEETILDSYDSLSPQVLRILENKNKKWAEKLFALIKLQLKKKLEEKQVITYKDVRDTI